MNDHFFEQDILDLGGTNGRIHPVQEFFAQTIHAGRTLQVLEAKFAQLRAMLGARLLALVAAPPSASERARFEALGIEVLLDDAKPALGASTSPHFCASACM